MNDPAAPTALPEDDPATIRAKRGELLSRIVFPPEKVIFREGEASTDAYVVQSGKVGVYKNSDGKMVRLAVMEKGAMFGEMAAITGEPRAATMIAIEPTVVVRITRAMMRQKIQACDPFVKALLDLLITNLSRVNERYVAKNAVLDKLVNDLKGGALGGEKIVDAVKEPAADGPAGSLGD